MDWDSLVARLWQHVEGSGVDALGRIFATARMADELAALLKALDLLLDAGQSVSARALLLETLSSHRQTAQLKRRLQLMLLFEGRRSPEAHTSTSATLDELIESTGQLVTRGELDQALEHVLGAARLAESGDYFELLGRIVLMRKSAASPAERGADADECRADESCEETDADIAFVELPEISLPDSDAKVRTMASARNNDLSLAVAGHANDLDEPMELAWLEVPDDESVQLESSNAAPAEIRLPARASSLRDCLTAEFMQTLPPDAGRVLRFFVENPGSAVAEAAKALALQPTRIYPLLAGGLQGLLTLQGWRVSPVENLAEAIAEMQGTTSCTPPVNERSTPPAMSQRPITARDVNIARRLSKLSPRAIEIMRLLHEKPSYVRDLAQQMMIDPAHVSALLRKDLGDFVHVKGGALWSLDPAVEFPAHLARILPRE